MIPKISSTLSSPAWKANYEDPPRTFQIRRRRTWLGLTLFIAAALLVLYLVDNLPPYSDSRQWIWRKTSEFSEEAFAKVPLEAHIMSKCPDAKDCLQDLVLPTMANVSDKVDFTLSFIGTPTDNDDGVDCKHGPSECLGNILELCAAELYPDPKIYLGFAMCLTGHYEDIPSRDLITDCSLEHGLDFEKLNNCVSQDDGEHGISLLRTSVKRTADANVTKSCTVRLNGQIRTIRDGGRWKDYEGGHDPEELVSDIQKLYKMSDEDWVPRRGPQPANAKAAYTKTAKGEKPTKIPVLTQTTKQSTDAAIEAETTAQSDDSDTKTDEVSSSSAVTTIPEDLFTTTTDTADSWEVTTLPDDLPPSPPSISPTGTLTPLEPYSALTETSSTTSSATTS